MEKFDMEKQRKAFNDEAAEVSKHIFALRMLGHEYKGGRPIETLYLYKSDSHVLTIDDFIKINSNRSGVKLICYFYGGFMTISEFLDRYKMDFILLDDEE